ncbi:MAG: hypothetical protein PHD07_02500 [Bacteroidales bacterium]|nr:hypothetical protein [Bacteroidales bacterium]MDD3201057.1 hypothetical protein [Bacteroidales bacterium]
MKKIIYFIGAILLAIIVSSCEKVQIDRLNGQWSECYDDPDFCMDGAVEYTFYGNNAYHLYTYDVLSGNTTDTDHYYLLEGDRLTLNPQMSDFSNVTYNIVLLNDKEMAWQKEGTTCSKGSYGSDYRHFLRKK